jgi:hypothetical protein
VLGDQQEARVTLLGVQQEQEQQQQQQHANMQQQQCSSAAPAGRRQQPAISQGRRSSVLADSQAEVLSLIWHPSDSAVKPIVANRRIERLAEPAWDAAALPFAPLTLQGMLECDQVELERFLTQVSDTEGGVKA